MDQPVLRLQRCDRSLYFSDTTVTKQGEPGLLRIEVEKNIRAREIGESCGLFYVPEIIEYDEDSGMVVFERIKNLRSLNDIPLRTFRKNSLMRRLAHALAVIHQNLKLPSEMVVPLPREFDAAGSKVFIHGDFNVRNICACNSGLQKLVIFDWQMSDRHGSRATWGSQYFDLFWFIYSLYRRPRIRCLWSDPVGMFGREMVKSYCAASGIRYDSQELAFYASSLFWARKISKTELKGHRTRLLASRFDELTRRFAASL